MPARSIRRSNLVHLDAGGRCAGRTRILSTKKPSRHSGRCALDLLVPTGCRRQSIAFRPERAGGRPAAGVSVMGGGSSPRCRGRRSASAALSGPGVGGRAGDAAAEAGRGGAALGARSQPQPPAPTMVRWISLEPVAEAVEPGRRRPQPLHVALRRVAGAGQDSASPRSATHCRHSVAITLASGAASRPAVAGPVAIAHGQMQVHQPCLVRPASACRRGACAITLELADRPSPNCSRFPRALGEGRRSTAYCAAPQAEAARPPDRGEVAGSRAQMPEASAPPSRSISASPGTTRTPSERDVRSSRRQLFPDLRQRRHGEAGGCRAAPGKDRQGPLPAAQIPVRLRPTTNQPVGPVGVGTPGLAPRWTSASPPSIRSGPRGDRRRVGAGLRLGQGPGANRALPVMICGISRRRWASVP